MGAKYWRGTAGDGDWSNANNWASARYGSTGAGAPASNDDVFILDGDKPIIDGLSQAAVDLNSLTVGDGYSGAIGTESAALTIAVSGTSGATFTYRGRGPYCKIAAGTNGIDRLHVESTGGGTIYLVGGTTTLLDVGTGNVTVEAAAVLTTLLRAGSERSAPTPRTSPRPGSWAACGPVTATSTTSRLGRARR
jgi:hypothetical protein